MIYFEYVEFPSFFFYVVLPTHMIKSIALLATAKVRRTRGKGLHNESMDHSSTDL